MVAQVPLIHMAESLTIQTLYFCLYTRKTLDDRDLWHSISIDPMKWVNKWPLKSTNDIL